ncbi:Cytochrome P450 [Apiospora hydei]|uniref:Cytochrome P450 n=1 Tax=Apiospora hydei TaxID=1337664 RepID=A0ABR1VHR8_9PEZI
MGVLDVFFPAVLAPSWVTLLLVPAATYLAVIFYRLTFDPLARFPGPKIAACTGLYEAYYQCFKEGGGRYWVEVEKMHRQYGPIVRINPREVHISDSQWNDVYKYSSKASKPKWFYFRFFGKFPSTNKYIPMVTSLIDKLVDRVHALEGRVVSLSDAYRCLATDVATGFAFGKPFGNLDEPTFDHEFNLSVRTVVKVSTFSRHAYGLLLPVLHSMPERFARKMNPAFGRVKWLMEINGQARSGPGTNPDVVQTLMASNLPAHEKTFPRLFSETRSVIMAGTETTGSLLVAITAYILNHPEKMEKLREELRQAEKAKGGAALQYSDIRELPYITGVVNEGLRLANPTPTRLPRVCPDQDLTYGSYVIPKGTTISTCVQDVHNDPAIFDSPAEFRPERWIDPAERRRLNRYLLPWGRGMRLCLGMELATIDTYMTVARLFSPSCPFRMRMHDTRDEDWKIYHEFFSGFPKGKGLEVMVMSAGNGINGTGLNYY